MRTLLAAAVPALLLLAAPTPGQAQMDQPPGGPRSGMRAGAEAGMSSGARDLVPSRDLIGKRVMYRHQGSVAGTIQDVTTGDDGQPAIALKLANSDRPLMLTPSDFERRGNRIVLMHDRDEVSQLAQYQSQATTGYGSSMGDTVLPNPEVGR